MKPRTDRMLRNATSARKVSGLVLHEYASPEQVSNGLTTKMRDRKAEDQEDWDSLMREAKHTLVDASPERLSAHVFRQLNERKHSLPPVPDPELTLHPKINAFKSNLFNGAPRRSPSKTQVSLFERRRASAL